ncbi:MAG: hypothetical protein M1812_007250 [Candelaria pacifica]|nr:MAG: hypothetical protein M1812_007250 [Candelaria pacifica]
MFAYPAIIILLWLHKTASVVAYPSDPCAIQWVNCSQNVPSLLDRTEVDLANLPSSLHCGRLDVPMDYSKPLSPSNVLTIGLAMYRPKEPKGVIFYNPGANDPAAVVAWQVALNQTDSFSGLTDFDLMMMDIRGTYSSNQLNVSLEAFNVLSGAYPSNQSDFNTFQNASAAAIQSFIDLSSPPGVIEHVGTVETVQDYESIRKALGYEQIHFLGAS